MSTASPVTNSSVTWCNQTGTYDDGSNDHGELTLRQGLELLGRALEQVARRRPEALVLVVAIVLVASFLVTGLPAIVVACHRRRQNAQTHAYERTMEQPLDSMHVALDSDTEAEDSGATTPPPANPSPGSFTLPRLNVSQIVAQFPSPPRDTDELHMTPRTQATILRQWTPRKQ